MSVDSHRRFRSIRGEFGSIVLGALHPHSMHAHEQVSMTFCVSGAAARMQTRDKIIEVSQGSVIVFNSGEPHATRPGRGDSTEILSLLLEPQWLEEILPIGNGTHKVFLTNHSAIGRGVELHLQELMKVIAADDAENLKGVGQLLASVVTATFRLIGQHRPDGSQPDLSILDYRIRKALRYMDDTIANRMQLGQIAKHVGLSRSHFFEQFRRCVGVPPSAYTNWHRMLIAADYLTHDSPTLAELSDLLGFSGPPQFYRFFVQQLGISPGEFRLNVRVVNDAVRSQRRTRPDLKPATSSVRNSITA